MIKYILNKLHIDLPPEVDEATNSNIIFAMVGLIGLAMMGFPLLLLSSILIYLTLGSAYYHYKDRHEYVWADWSAMYMTYTGFVALFAYLITDLWFIIPIGGVAGALLSYYHHKLDKLKLFKVQYSFLTIGILYAVTLVLSFFVMHYLFAILSAIFYGAGFVCRTLADQDGKYSSNFVKEFYDTFHGWWHILVGVGMMTHFIGIYFMFFA